MLSVPFYSLKTNVYIVIVKFRARHFITIMCRASERASIKVQAFFLFSGPPRGRVRHVKKIANIVSGNISGGRKKWNPFICVQTKIIMK